LAAIAIAAAEERTWNFDRDEAGKIAKDFSNESGDWEVVADESAPSKPNALAQTASDMKAPFNVALATDSSFKDVDLSVKMKAIAGNEDQGGGLVWRAKDGQNYYVVRFNPLEDNFRVYKVVNGSQGDRRREFQRGALHYWGRGRAVELAQTLQSALKSTQVAALEGNH
jgi:hypothetical protein